jgi:hypothetical protein
MISPLVGAAGLIGNSGRNTADAGDRNVSETKADTTAHFIFVGKATFIEVRTPFPA